MSHLSSHRPMFPEYQYRPKNMKNIQFLFGRYCFSEEGEAFPIKDYDALYTHIVHHNLLIFVSSLVDLESFLFLEDCLLDHRVKIICDRKGNVLAIRLKGERNRSYWIMTMSSWYVEEGMSAVAFIKGMRLFFEYIAEGVMHSPSAYGKQLMRKIYAEQHLKRITGLSLSSENFIRQYSFGGIVYTPGIGTYHDRTCKIDKYNAYLSQWGKDAPIGAAVLFLGEYVDTFAAFFAECEITIPRELPLGPFPFRETRRLVHYPTTRGTYTTFLFDNQIEDVRSSGCIIRIKRGIGWRETCDYNQIWAYYMHDLRMNAPSDFIAKNVKLCAVAAMGSFAGGRTHYYLVPPERREETMPNAKNERGEPLDMYIAEEHDYSSALLIHHNKRMIASVNSEVYNFAKPFAENGTLLMADYDSIMTKEVGDEGEKYIKRRSIDAFKAPIGTWMLEYRHNVKITAPRAYTCDEESKQPGIARKKEPLKIL